MRVHRAFTVATVGAVLAVGLARSGHELPVYPSYYPHEIEIATVSAHEAAELLRTGKLHAYVGDLTEAVPAADRTVSVVESLGSLVVVRINPASLLATDKPAACAAVATLIRDMAHRAENAGVTIHPYPVTPWHGDYLYHADRADAAKARIFAAAAAVAAPVITVRADTPWAKSLVAEERLAMRNSWDVAIERVDVARLVTETTLPLNGWIAPRWARAGWFHAFRVLGEAVRDPTLRPDIDARVARLKRADYRDKVERINLERDLVQALASNCQAAVAGYTVRREFFNSEFSAGIENLSFDALEGLSSPMFLRTVKLKDYPWNGVLRLGIGAHPDSPWNPIAGFGDPFGRLAWYAIADPALLPSPYEASWILNRASDAEIFPPP